MFLLLQPSTAACKGSRTVRLTSSGKRFHDRGSTIPKGMPGVSLLLLRVCLPLHSRGPGAPFVTSVCSQKTLQPLHTAKQQYKLKVNHTRNTTAERTPAFSGMALCSQFSVHKSGGRKGSNKQPLWHCCGLHVEHLHTQVIYCVCGMTPGYLWCGVLINSHGWACWQDVIYFIYQTKLFFFLKDIEF